MADHEPQARKCIRFNDQITVTLPSTATSDSTTASTTKKLKNGMKNWNDYNALRSRDKKDHYKISQLNWTKAVVEVGELHERVKTLTITNEEQQLENSLLRKKIEKETSKNAELEDELQQKDDRINRLLKLLRNEKIENARNNN